MDVSKLELMSLPYKNTSRSNAAENNHPDKSMGKPKAKATALGGLLT